MSRQTSTTKLSTVADVLQGQSPESRHYSDSEGTPFLQGNRTFGNLYPSFDTYTKKVTKLARKGEVLMSVRAPVGALNFAPCDLCIGRGLASIKAKNGDNHFIYYALKYNVANLIKQGGATTFDSVNKDLINDFELIIPSDESERRKVSSMLSALDDKIEINNKINAELEQMAKTLYDYWFVQFDFPDANGKPYKSSGGKMLYSTKLKRNIPANWKSSNILAVADLLGGGTPSKQKPEFWGGTIPFFTPTDSGRTIFKFTTEDYITEKGLKESSTKLFEKNTVIITARGSVGRLVLTGTEMAMNQSCYALRAKKDVSQTYLYFLTKELIHHLQVKATGSVFNSIVSTDIEFTDLSIPDPALVSKFGHIAGPLFDDISSRSRESQKLAELRDWLLPMLMNGQVTVK